MSRMIFDVIERAQQRPSGRGALGFLLWTLLLAAILFWGALIVLI